ncbi:MAG: alanine--tRNA ligase-related protein, partial [Planctomycetota bacterium]
MPPSSSEIRQQFIDFFVDKHGHAHVPSSPVIPHDDPTLLFANAGMNQFKPIFLGEEKLDHYGPPRAANSQKCIRAGGKHNDLDDVGRDTYHHTFFEMLGNWSFGDYFKEGAIDMAWELLVTVWGLDPERLHATYFEGDASEGLEPDTEAKELWAKYLPAERIHPGNKKDNFWEMGDVGPCGPCSEIHYDRSDDKSGGGLVNADGQDTVVEIWNLVFIQFNRTASGLKPLPAKHVDTGMGFERIVRVLQGKTSNYDTDVFTPLLDKIAGISGKAYQPELTSSVGIAFRAIADHARMATFAISDGAMPDGKGRGSVVRSVIRRAVRFGYQTLGLREPFLHRLVDVVQQQMGEAFLDVRETTAAKVIESEERDFLSVVDRGLEHYAFAKNLDLARTFASEQGWTQTRMQHLDWRSSEERGNEVVSKAEQLHVFSDENGDEQVVGYRELIRRVQERGANPTLSGREIFELHTTFGFPPDMTMQLAREDGFVPDVAEYERLFEEFQNISGKGNKVAGAEAVDFGDLPETDDSPKFSGEPIEATLLAFVRDGDVVTDGKLQAGETATLLFNRTNHYGEQGGQVGDVGVASKSDVVFEIETTQRAGGRVLHVGELTSGSLAVGDTVTLAVDNRRSEIRRHHTVTHLLNLALRQVLGEHVAQRGSLVDDTKTRFDFSHDKAMTLAEVGEVERRVNAMIRQNLPVRADLMPLAEAKAIEGVRAVFGEKYPDPVRVVYATPGDATSSNGATHSIEFCGGTHADRTGDIGLFKIVAEEAVSKGVRRVTGVASQAAIEHVQKLDKTLVETAAALSVKPDDAADRAAAMRDEIKKLKKQLASGGGGAGFDASAIAADLIAKAEGAIMVAKVAAPSDDALRSVIDAMKSKQSSYAVLLASPGEEKVSIVAGVSDDLIK